MQQLVATSFWLGLEYLCLSYFYVAKTKHLPEKIFLIHCQCLVCLVWDKQQSYPRPSPLPSVGMLLGGGGTFLFLQFLQRRGVKMSNLNIIWCLLQLREAPLSRQCRHLLTSSTLRQRPGKQIIKQIPALHIALTHFINLLHIHWRTSSLCYANYHFNLQNTT